MRGNPWGNGQRLPAASSGGTDRLPLLPQDSAAEAKNAQKSARATGLEPATSGVTGGRSNQLSYARRGSEHRRPTHGPTEPADSSHWSFCFFGAEHVGAVGGRRLRGAGAALELELSYRADVGAAVGSRGQAFREVDVGAGDFAEGV